MNVFQSGTSLYADILYFGGPQMSCIVFALYADMYLGAQKCYAIVFAIFFFFDRFYLILRVYNLHTTQLTRRALRKRQRKQRTTRET